MHVLTAFEPTPSPARTREPDRAPLRIGAVQHRLHAEPEEHRSRDWLELFPFLSTRRPDAYGAPIA